MATVLVTTSNPIQTNALNKFVFGNPIYRTQYPSSAYSGNVSLLVDHSALIPQSGSGPITFNIPKGVLVIVIDTNNSTHIAETAQPLLVTGPPVPLEIEL